MLITLIVVGGIFLIGWMDMGQIEADALDHVADEGPLKDRSDVE